MDESQRIRDVYAERQRSMPPDYYSIFRSENLYRVQRLDRAVLGAFAREGLREFSGLRLLEVGCGTGSELVKLVGWGASPAQLAGVDLIPERVAIAQERLPTADLRVADATALPYEDGRFDVVSQFTVLSSVLDPGIREAIAREMLRVLKPGGFVLWYDMRVVRPDRPLVAMTRREIGRLFPRAGVRLGAVTLNPLVAKVTAKLSWCLSDIIALIPGAKSHYLGEIRP